MELDGGTFVVKGAGAHFPITLIGNSYNLRCSTPGCEIKSVDSNNEGPIFMLDEVIQPSARPPASPVARICHCGPELTHLELHEKPEGAALTSSDVPEPRDPGHPVSNAVSRRDGCRAGSFAATACAPLSGGSRFAKIFRSAFPA
jgi:hypothetical protein